jgi:hypothetical protein
MLKTNVILHVNLMLGLQIDCVIISAFSSEKINTTSDRNGRRDRKVVRSLPPIRGTIEKQKIRKGGAKEISGKSGKVGKGGVKINATAGEVGEKRGEVKT